MEKKLSYLILIIGLLHGSSVWAEGSRWQSPEMVEGTVTVSLEQAKVLHANGIKFVDVRSLRQYKKRHIQSAVHLYINDALTKKNLLNYIKKDEPFVIYCNGAHCSLSYKAAEKAVAWGFTGIKYFRDGFRSWRLDGNPLEYGA